MEYSASIITLTLLTLVFAGCSKHSPNTASTFQKDSGTQTTQETVDTQNSHDTVYGGILQGPLGSCLNSRSLNHGLEPVMLRNNFSSAIYC